MDKKFYLGKLCKNSHYYEDTGQTLRFKSDSGCVECKRISRQQRNKTRKNNSNVKYYLGELCSMEHRYNGGDKSLRYVSTNDCIECKKLSDKKSYNVRVDEILNNKKQYYSNNKELFKIKNLEYYQDNKDNIIEKNKQYYQDNKEYLNQKGWERVKQRLIDDPIFRLNRRMSNSITKALKLKNSSKKGLSYLDYVDFTLNELKNHLEIQFVEGMSWDNYGEWHVDHIKPKVNFDYNSPVDIAFKECWSLNNFQPLWRSDNLSKSSKSMEEYIKYKNRLKK
jgi:hypothetical protein